MESRESLSAGDSAGGSTIRRLASLRRFPLPAASTAASATIGRFPAAGPGAPSLLLLLPLAPKPVLEVEATVLLGADADADAVGNNGGSPSGTIGT